MASRFKDVRNENAYSWGIKKKKNAIRETDLVDIRESKNKENAESKRKLNVP